MQTQKVAVVTGSSKGIGKALAIRLAQDGYFVYVTYHTDEKGGLTTIKEIENNGGNAFLYQLDVSSEKSVIQLMKLVEKNHKHLDVLINNAEKDITKKMEDASFDEWKLAFDTKLHGAWLSTKYALPLLKKSENANVIMIASTADSRPSPDMLSYAVAVAAFNSLTKALAIHLPPFRIRVNAVVPGPTRTANWGELEKDDKLWERFAKSNPMKRATTVQDVADAALLLINDPHKFINGNFLCIDGGSQFL